MSTSDTDSYIVRVYRRSPGDPRQLVGIVEQVSSGRETPFHSVEELWQILASGSRFIRRRSPGVLRSSKIR